MADTSGELEPHCRWQIATAGLVVCAAGLLIAYHPTILTGFGRVQEEFGDTRFNHSLLEHSWRWLIGDPLHRSYFDPPFFYPVVNVLAYSDVLLGAAPAYWPWRLLGLEPDTSFQLWQLVVSTLNFATCMLFLRSGLRLQPWSSALGAAIFAFAGTRIAQLGHCQLLPHYGLPLLAFAVVRFMDPSWRGRGGRWAAMGASAVVVQLYAGFYLGWFLVLGFGVAFAWSLALSRTRKPVAHAIFANRGSLTLSLGLAAVALAPLAWHYWLASREVGVRSFAEALSYIPRPASWIRTSGTSWLYGWSEQLTNPLLPSGTGYEHMLSYGLLASLLGVSGLAGRRHQPAFLLLGISAATLFALALVPFGHFTLWRVVYWLVPGAKAIRAVGRIGLLLLFPISAGIAAILDTLEARGLRVPLLGLMIALVCEQGLNGPTFSKLDNRKDIQWLAQSIPEGCQSFFFTPINGASPFYKYQIDAIWASMERRLPTLNGYSGNLPKGWLPFWDVVIRTPDDRKHIEAALRRWPAEHKIRFDERCWVAAVPRDTPGGENLVNGLKP